MTDYNADSVDAAIELAEQFKSEGRYDWFRGQARPWRPQSSLLRMQRDDPSGWQKVVIPKFNRFFGFLRSYPETTHLSDDGDAALAVAQHYGLPTPLMDFTTDPAIAGFFACDTKDHNIEHSIIYCLNTEELRDLWESLSEAESGFTVAFHRNTVSNLWRLESQHGVFLEIQPGNWDDFFGMDRIVFPHSERPAFPPRSHVYPDNKSSLEILLDQYLEWEKGLERQANFEAMMKAANIPITTVDAWPDNYDATSFVTGGIPMHPSWNETVIGAWHDSREERFYDMAERSLPIAVDLTGQPDRIRQSVGTALRAALRMQKKLRAERVTWRIENTRSKATQPDSELLENAFERIWDGLRRLPYTDGQIATSMAVAAYLFALGLRQDTQRRQAQEIAEVAFGPNIEVEFASIEGPYARSRVSRAAIRAAWREDLDDYLVEDLDQLKNEEAVFLRIHNPKRLFAFDRLCGLFADSIVPWHMLNGLRGSPFFSPTRLSSFGIP